MGFGVEKLLLRTGKLDCLASREVSCLIGDLLVNEIVQWPRYSGHYIVEACTTNMELALWPF